MVDAVVVEGICEDENFLKLVDDATESEEFARLLDEHVQGYSQKKRFSDGLKEFTKKVEDAENRIIVARNVGKFKEPDPEDVRWTSKCTSFELKQKSQAVTDRLEAMLKDGTVSAYEKPAVLENLHSRIAKAKEANKAKVVEKLSDMLSAVAKKEPFQLPVKNIEEFDRLDKELKAIAKLEKLSSKNLTYALRERIESKADLEKEYDALMDISRMWFETPLEFRPRLEEAIAAYAANEEERKRREEEEAFEKKKQEEEEALEKKRAAADQKNLEAAKALEAKLEAKRVEAAAKPVKEVPKKQPKEKKAVATIDLQHMFKEERQLEYERVSAAELQAELEAEAQQREYAKLYAELKQATAEAETAKRERAIKETKAAKEAEKAKLAYLEQKKEAEKALRSAKAALKEPKKQEPAKHVELAKPKSAEEIAKSAEEKAVEEEKKFKAIEEKLAAKRLEAESKPQKEVKEPPKREKKVATKMSLLDFYDQDLVLEKLAAQEAQEKLEREAAAKEAARLQAEEEAAWEAEENAAWTAEEAARTSQLARTPEPATTKIQNTTSVEKKEPAPKPKAKVVRKPVEIESKWGAPVALPEGYVLEDDADMPSLAEASLAMPSLAEALTAPVKKTPPPQPKKKEKKKWGKVDANLIGFDADNLNVYS